ncbi:MAG: glycosyltransferase [Anaerolineales bacterium]|nr:glycosyltransferase [Anaerolineales bacterium]
MPTEQEDLKQAHEQIAEKDQIIVDLRRQIGERDRLIADKEAMLQEILHSRSWRLMQRMQAIRLRLIPLGSRREALMYSAGRGLRVLRRDGLRGFICRLSEILSHRLQVILLRMRLGGAGSQKIFSVQPVQPRPPLQPHQASVDIIVCVHNALEDVQRCLESLIRCTMPPYNLILVDDGSEKPTQDYLADFSLAQGALLLRNEEARGYTRAANQGMQASSADYLVLLNSDTIVTAGWLDRMIACAESDPRIGIVGPLSNTASWQSIPDIFNADGDWAENPLPQGLSIAEMGQRVANYSGRVYPRPSFLNGFCLMIKRGLVNQIGYFDEENFGAGYAEENDYCLRTAKAGWHLAVADDAYIYHAQSRSYSHERRKILVERSDKAFGDKHGHQVISQALQRTQFNPALLGNRARSQVIASRQDTIEIGRQRWEGKRIAFYLPISAISGGGHLIMQEARAMQKMGVHVDLINLQGHQAFFQSTYPDLPIPSIYVQDPTRSSALLLKYDAVVASMYHTVSWLQLPDGTPILPRRGYYILDFEPFFFQSDTPEYKQAWESYTLFPDLVRMTKTEWNRQMVLKNIGVDCQGMVGPSVDIDLFRPRPRKDPSWPARPLRITAMIRPSTPRRQAALTMQVLHEISRKHGSSVEIILFGCTPNDPAFNQLDVDFTWRHAGILTPPQLAALLNEVDIFADFSSFQALGLTAMEAMACGVAAIVPQEGGAVDFAHHEQNTLVCDTASLEACVACLDRLIRDEHLRISLQQQAIFDICQHFPEKVAYHILEALFPA